MAALTADGNLTYSRDGGSLTATTVGTITYGDGKADLTASGAKYLQWSPFKNTPKTRQFDVEIWVEPNYSGNCASVQAFFHRNSDGNGEADRFLLSHQTNNGLYLQSVARGDTTSVTAQFNVTNWNPVAGTVYKLRASSNWDTTKHRIWQNGTIVASDTTTSGDAYLLTSILRVGVDATKTNVADFKCHRLIVRDTVEYDSNYTPVDTLPLIYSTTARSVESRLETLVSAWTAFSTTQSASGSDTVKHSPIINGVRKYWNGSAWVTASAGESNTVAEINSNCSTLITSGTNATIDLISYLTSANGYTTPTLTSATITYTAALALDDQPDVTDVRAGTVYNNGASTGTMDNVTNEMANADLAAIGPLTANLVEV